jgi:hypothetical protein
VPDDHRLVFIDASHGSVSSIYIAWCSCGKGMSDARTEEKARELHREHAEGLTREGPESMKAPPEGW